MYSIPIEVYKELISLVFYIQKHNILNQQSSNPTKTEEKRDILLLILARAYRLRWEAMKVQKSQYLIIEKSLLLKILKSPLFRD